MIIENWALGYPLTELSCWNIDADDDSAVDDNADEVKDGGDDGLQHEQLSMINEQWAFQFQINPAGLWVLILADDADGSDENIDKDWWQFWIAGNVAPIDWV